MTHRLPLSDVVASLSHALDLTEGQSPGHSIRSCLLGMHVGRAVGLDSVQLTHLYYALLLKDAGCSANAAPVAAAFGADDHPLKRAFKTTNWSDPVSAAVYVARHAAHGGTAWTRLRHILGLARGGTEMARSFTRIRCERGAAIVTDLGFSAATAAAIRHLDEHWNGGGHPDGIAEDAIPLLARICCLAQTTEVFLHAQGLDRTLSMLLARRGEWFDPVLADVLLDEASNLGFWRKVTVARGPAALAGQEPGEGVRWIESNDLDRVAEAFADIIDAKTPCTWLHSRGVAHIGQSVARRLGCSPPDVRTIYRAGLLHDIGKLGISNRILDKPGPLTEVEFAEIKRHPRYSIDILSHVAAFSDIARPAAHHHERLDGSGYPWGLAGDQLDLPSRIVAVADVYEALTADRPYRAGHPPRKALEVIASDAGTAFDTDVVSALRDWVREMTPDARRPEPGERVHALAG